MNNLVPQNAEELSKLAENFANSNLFYRIESLDTHTHIHTFISMLLLRLLC